MVPGRTTRAPADARGTTVTGRAGTAALGTLDYVYAPSADVAADVRWLGAVLDAAVVFAIESEGTRVAMLRMGSGAPPMLVADHLHDQRPIFLFRVEDIE